jgi:hypothetical protein
MVTFAIFFTLGVLVLQQQAALPDFAWAWLLMGLPLPLLINSKNSWLSALRILLIATLGCGLGF